MLISTVSALKAGRDIFSPPAPFCGVKTICANNEVRLLRPLEVLIPAATGYCRRPGIRKFLSGNRIGLFRFRQPQGNGNSRCPLRLPKAPRIAGITSRLSLNYEWGFGASFGWKPYDYLSNPNNTVMGSKVNAYLSAGIHLNWILSPRFDLNIGATADISPTAIPGIPTPD